MNYLVNKTEKQNLERFLSNLLTKADYDDLTTSIPEVLQISPKTWYNYRYSLTRIPHSAKMAIVNILINKGYTVAIIDNEIIKSS